MRLRLFALGVRRWWPLGALCAVVIVLVWLPFAPVAGVGVGLLAGVAVTSGAAWAEMEWRAVHDEPTLHVRTTPAPPDWLDITDGVVRASRPKVQPMGQCDGFEMRYRTDVLDPMEVEVDEVVAAIRRIGQDTP